MNKGPNIKRCNKSLEKFKELYSQEDSDYFKEYLEFSKFIQGCFISEDGYIIDTGNFQTVNRQLMYEIMYKIQKHPILWKIFFMIA